MSVVVVIPARGGSKGIPRKNLQPINGVPLVGWSVRAALAAESVDAVYVSTEDAEITEAAKAFGALVIPRPTELAADESPTLPVIKHAADASLRPALEWIGNAGRSGAVVCLECTSPFTTAADVDGVVAMYQADPSIEIVASVCRDHRFQVRESPNGVQWISYDLGQGDCRRQDLPPIYRLAGGLRLYRLDRLPDASHSFDGRVRLFEIPEDRAIDIDSPLDLHLARALATSQDQWIVIGSSPSARESFANARAAYPAAKTITTNYGHELFEGADRPDYYHIHDSIACEIHAKNARALAAKGTRTITLYRPSSAAIKRRGVEWFDEFLKLSSHEQPGRFRRGAYASCGLSGLMILQYALNHGAKGVHLVGMEGYRDKGHYFNQAPDLGPEKDRRFTRGLIQPFVQSCVDACPEVQFTFYGQLEYSISGKNVQCVK